MQRKIRTTTAALIVTGAIAGSSLVLSPTPLLLPPATAQDYDDWDDDFDDSDGFDDDFDDFDGFDEDFDGGDEDFDSDFEDFDDFGGDNEDDFDSDDFDADFDDFLDDDDAEDGIDDDDDNEDEEDDDEEDEADDDDAPSALDGASPDIDASIDGIEFDDDGFAFESGEILAFDIDPVELEIARDLGFEPVESRNLDSVDGRVVRLAIPDGFSTTRQALTALSQTLPAAPFDYNYVYQLPERPTQSTGSEFLYDNIGEPRSGAGIRIGVIDTLVDPSHPSLIGQSITVADFAGEGGRDVIHATAVVSILTGDDRTSGYRGLLPGSEVYSANVFSLDEQGRPSSNVYVMAAALDWVASHDVGVINASLAGPQSEVIRTVLARLDARGHHVVAAVGNEGPAAPPLYPSAYENVTGVTAIDLEGRVYRRAGRGDQVDFAAPGVRVLAADAAGGYRQFTGTSFATPVVSAFISQQIRVRGERSPGDILSKQSVRDLGEPGRDETFGLGLILAPTDNKP
ncbi:MAG: S8 family serine peptidase [Woeseiaceae bacterium]|nr:S8 family serine peptidase [Woeseiaceae bacterium]